MDLTRKIILPEHVHEAEPPTFWLRPYLAGDNATIEAAKPSPLPETDEARFQAAVDVAPLACAIGIKRFENLTEDGEPIPWPEDISERQEIVRRRFPLWWSLKLARIYQAAGEIAQEEERKG